MPCLHNVGRFQLQSVASCDIFFRNPSCHSQLHVCSTSTKGMWTSPACENLPSTCDFGQAVCQHPTRCEHVFGRQYWVLDISTIMLWATWGAGKTSKVSTN